MEEWICSRCNKVLNNIAVDRAFSVVYDKCKGRECPDCGKIRKIGSVKMIIFNAGASDNCPRCGKDGITAEFSSSSTQGTCEKCFWEREEKKGCICVYSRCKWGRYYCFLCEDIHKWFNFKCEECANKAEIEVKVGGKLLRLWQVVVPSLLGGIIIGIFIGYFLKKISKKVSK